MNFVKTFIFISAAALSLSSAELFREDFARPEAAGESVVLEHGVPESMVLTDGMVLLDNLGKAQGSRACLMPQAPADVDIEFSMRFLDELPRGGYAGIIFQRPIPGKPGIGVFLTDNSAYLQVEIAPGYDVEYLQIAQPQNGWHKVKVTAKEGKLRIAVDAQVILDRTDIPFLNGDICLRTWNCKVAFDDFVVRTPEEKTLAVRNLLANGSFEEALSPNMPYAWGIAAWGLTEERILKNLPEFRQEWRRDTDNPKHGRYCMRVGMTNLLASCYFPVQAEADYVLSAWVRGRTPGKALRVRYCNIQGAAYEFAEKGISLTDDWQRVTWQLPRTKLNMAAVYFYGPEDEEYYVDAVSITQGTDIPEEYIESASVEDMAAETENLPEIKAEFVDRSPELDKFLDEPLWKNAAAFALKITAGAEPVNKTLGWIMHDAENLYIAMKCLDNEPETIKGTIRNRDGMVWEDDCVELFIGPAGRHKDWSDYYHLGISVTGAIFDGHKTDPSWNMEWQAQTRRTAEGWEVVAAIPFASLKLSDSCRGDWIVNFCRENPRAKEYSAWSPTYGSFHTAERFGTLKALPSEIMDKWIGGAGVVNDNANIIPVVAAKKNGRDYLPFGITWQSINLPGEALFRELQQSGMNRLVWAVATSSRTPGEIRQVLDYALQYSIDVTFWILGEWGAMGMPFEKWPEHIVKTIHAYKDHPAIADWMVLDEPHDHDDIVSHAVTMAKNEDPTRPVFINVTPHGLGLRIGGLPGDVLCFDRYGFFFDGSTLADVGISARAAAKVASERPRPVFACIQGMGHDLWVPRSPMPDEMTAQSYLALVSGASGFFYFNGVVHAKDTWERMGEIAWEFQRLFPVVLSPEIADVKCSCQDVFFMARRLNGRMYVIAVNQSRENLNTVFTFDQTVNSCREFFAGKRIPISEHKLEITFKPLERLCLEID